jgi:uncharacterized protein
MQILHILPTAYQTHSWSGGKTTELYIYPEDSQYKNLDFLFRLSRATIEQEETYFTPLAGVKRSLMLLEGELTLTHEKQEPKALERFEVDDFVGDWHTRSVGKAQDFNLMCRQGANGTLKKRILKNARPRRFWQENAITDYKAVAYYVYEGEIEVMVGRESYVVCQDELLVFFPEHTAQSIRIKALAKSIWIASYIQ